MDLHGNNAAAIRTFFVDEIEYDTQGLEFSDYAKSFLLSGLTGIAAVQLALPPVQGGFSLPAEEAAKEAPFVAQSFMAHYAGDESPDEAVFTQLQGYLSFADPRYQALGEALGTLWSDLPPADGNALLELKPSLTLSVIGSYATGIFDEGAAEICAYDPSTKTLFVVNGENKVIDMLDLSDPSTPVHVGSIDVSPYGHAPNSVAAHGGMVAVAVEAENSQAPGKVAVFSTAGDFLKAFSVGALPDMVTFTPNGRYILCANEGEPNDDYTVDPEGSVSIIDLRAGLELAHVKTADFKRFNRKKAILLKRGCASSAPMPRWPRIWNPNISLCCLTAPMPG